MKDKDELDQKIIEEVRPLYEQMRATALAKMKENPNTERVHELDHVRVNGRKLTVMLYLDRRGEKLVEQFEYYDYRYWHYKILEDGEMK